MPWSPEQAKKKYRKLTKKQSEVWSQVANSALESGDDEATAIKKANAAVNRMRHKEAQAEAATILYEIGRTISSANMTKLKTALSSMKTAVEAIEPLIADDAEEAVENTSNVIIDQEIDPILKLAEVHYQKWELAKLSEAARILAQDDSYDATRMAVAHALRKRALQDAMAQKVASGDYEDYYYSYGCTPYIRDLYDGYVVYSHDGMLYQCEYTISGDEVTLGDATEVRVSYVPVSGSAAEAKDVVVEGDLVTLQEKAVKDNGTVRVKLISPGWGSSGFYSKDMLKRDGPKVFKSGTHMYMNHPTEEEAKNRPERDVRDLVGALVTDAKWEEASSKNTGEGLYADARVYEQYRSFVNEAAPDIGVSIRASGSATEGEASGRHGLIVNGLNEAFSVDYVTLPGRGGQILSLFESARNKANTIVADEIVEKKGTNVVDVTSEQLNAFEEAAKKATALEMQLAEANKTVARLNEAMTLTRAREIVASLVNAANLHDITKNRLMNECVRTLPLTDGILDEAKLRENTENTIKEEITYLESVGSVSTGGKVVGMGSTPGTDMSMEEVDKGLAEGFESFGFTSDKAKNIATRGRF